MNQAQNSNLYTPSSSQISFSAPPHSPPLSPFGRVGDLLLSLLLQPTDIITTKPKRGNESKSVTRQISTHLKHKAELINKLYDRCPFWNVEWLKSVLNLVQPFGALVRFGADV
jgi:hypothetical protein